VCASSPDDAWADDVFATLRARLEILPPGPPFATRRCPLAGVVGREVSGVAIGVDSFEVRSL